mmetsp:Transcript_158384/g.384652  ORF Transcript_158384/g.384652 Transcript_158384/m.384652 type:complete len:235 (-) Transcript_158384:274-978(-)
MMLVVLFMVILATVSASANPRPDYDQLQVQGREQGTLEVFHGDQMVYHAIADNSKPKKSDNNVEFPGILVQIGKTAWGIIQSNKQVVDYKVDWSGAIPKGYEDDWIGLAGWKDVKSEVFEFKYKIGGSTVSQFKWRFAWSAEGYTMEGGEKKGQYIQNAGARIEKLYAKVGQTVNANVLARSPVNYGTQEQPIGGIDVEVQFGSANNFNENVITCTVTLRGDSQYKVQNCAADH